MSQFKKIRQGILLALFFIAYPLVSNSFVACTCAMNEDLEKATFEKYPFVALVKITGVYELNRPVRTDIRSYPYLESQRILEVTTKELYRGERLSYLLEADAHSSCGTFVSEGQEWIVYGLANRGGVVELESCTPSTIVRNHKGESVMDYGYPQRSLDWLNERCGVRPASVSDVGSSVSRRYFASGNIAEEHHYRNGVLHGSSVHYYANGKLMDLAYFKNGTPAGERIHCAEDGTMDFKLLFSEKGELTRKMSYTPDYDGLINEILFLQDPAEAIMKRFNPDGGLREWRKGPDWWDWREIKHYDESGQLIHHSVYDEEGEVTVLMGSGR